MVYSVTMKCRIMQEMSFAPIPIDSPRDPFFTIVDDDPTMTDIRLETVWTWVAQIWDDGEPPWRDGSMYTHVPLPKTWAARETIHMGYKV